ncbi:glutathione S-transferase [Pseudorhodoferax sp. Leaf274]|uniref:glutathione S-transferase n=1 Tax=Pseudorhodoferax sp. Leaf274 TaxID=1736318 RepID=UPI000702DC71|nr:glutathione S-transferase [Pseudorhodoferax sp. Leaf274]KQP49458.1 glutathione S-transferase [Pseudorhodoferax sp. Leaf274]
MQLLYAPTSPFVRKVMVCAHLSGQADRIQWLDSAAHPVRRDARIAAHNPLAKVPTLVLGDGQSLYDSRVICEYIDSLGSAGLFPAAGPARWTALTRQALGDGLLDAALLARYELTARPPEVQWPVWREALLAKVGACVEAIDAIAPELATAAPASPPTIGEIAVGCGLGYLDFRFPDLDWRASHAACARWYAGFAQLPAMQATLPHDA